MIFGSSMRARDQLGVEEPAQVDAGLDPLGVEQRVLPAAVDPLVDLQPVDLVAGREHGDVQPVEVTAHGVRVVQRLARVVGRDGIQDQPDHDDDREQHPQRDPPAPVVFPARRRAPIHRFCRDVRGVPP